MQASLVFLISFLVSQVVSYEFFLTYRRIGRLEGNRNDLIFHCHVTGNYSSQDFSYWINKTEQVDILNGIPSKYAAVRVSEGAVFFNIQPQYEGTFYCGEMDGEKSNGVGPLIGMKFSQCVVQPIRNIKIFASPQLFLIHLKNLQLLCMATEQTQLWSVPSNWGL